MPKKEERILSVRLAIGNKELEAEWMELFRKEKQLRSPVPAMSAWLKFKKKYKLKEKKWVLR